MRNTPEYQVWHNMKKRCNLKSHPDYAEYGGRGVKVCDTWLESFSNFYDDMGNRPTPKHSIDRIDNNRGYSKDNCRWATKLEQNLNQRIRKNNTSGAVGVCVKRGRWIAQIKVDSKTIFIGGFRNKEDAVKARQKAEIQYWEKS